MTTKGKIEKAGMTKTLATFVHGLEYESLPETVRELAKGRILDALSSAYCGHNLKHSQTAIEIAKNSPGSSTIFGLEPKVALPEAIMANAVLAHSTLQEDSFAPAAGHPSTIMVPTALGVGEQERASGKETLVAIVLGYELMGRLGKSARPLAISSFRSGPILGTFGAAATAGRLMKLDVEKLTHTLGYAASLTPGIPNECWWGGNMDSMFEAGVCARTGLLSATLAKGGATAAPYVLEGKDGFFRCWAGTIDRASALTEGLGKTFVMLETRLKPYPACRVNQLPIQTARPLARLGLRAEDIARVIEKTWPGETSLAGSDFAGPFASQFQAQMSMQFCVAAAILGRPVDSVSFYTGHYDDPEVGKLARKVELVCETGRTKYRIEVYALDGRTFVAEEETVNYEPLTPSLEKMEKKFIALASAFLGKKRVQQIIDLVRNLDKTDDIRELMVKL